MPQRGRGVELLEGIRPPRPVDLLPPYAVCDDLIDTGPGHGGSLSSKASKNAGRAGRKWMLRTLMAGAATIAAFLPIPASAQTNVEISLFSRGHFKGTRNAIAEPAQVRFTAGRAKSRRRSRHADGNCAAAIPTPGAVKSADR